MLFDRLRTRVPTVIIIAAPAALLFALTALTVLVWRNQVAQQHLLMAKHTEDIAVQASQRLEDLIEGDLRIATVMARRWAQDDTHTRARFEGFARLLTKEMRVFDAVALLDDDRKAGWVQPDEPGTVAAFTGPIGNMLASALMGGATLAISASDPVSSGRAGFYAMLPIESAAGRAGYLGIHFHADALVRQVFHDQLLDEFEVIIRDGEATLFHATRPPPEPTTQTRLLEALDPPPRIDVELKVRNRTWQLSMQPLEPTKMATWTGNLAVPRLGMLGAVLISVAVYLLLVRMRRYQLARDEALEQVAERQRVEQALRRSEVRYREVFSEASDGLIMIDAAGLVVEANAAAAAMLGLECEAMLHRRLGEFYGEPAEDRCRTFLASQAATMPRHEAAAARGDGQRLELEIRATVLRQDDRARALVIVGDVTERKRALERHAMLSRKVLVAQEEERARVARELHDELGQVLTAIRLELGWFKKRVDTDKQVDMDILQEAVKLVERATDESRRLVRGLRPPLLDDLGLEPALRLLVDEFKDHSQVRCDLDFDVDDRLRVPHEIALCTYRILQESLTNVSRHAKATRVDVSLRVSSGKLGLDVVDDGRGFDPDRRHGCGIEGMTERANLVNGSIRIQSTPGAGTRVSFTAVLPRLGQELSA